MAINKDQLISLLAEKTGADPEEVGRQLSQLIYRIRNAAGEGKSFEIEGLGTFSLKDDQLQFTPNQVLETEINNKYTGMKPIELIGAFKGADVEAGNVELTESPPPQKPETEVEIEQARWAFDETTAEEQARIEKAIFGKSFGDTVNEEPPAPSEAVEAPEPPPADPVIRPKETDSKSDDDPIGKVLTIVAVILVILVGGWLVYDYILKEKYTTRTQLPLQNQAAPQKMPSQEVQISTVDATSGEVVDEVSEPIQAAGVTKSGNENFLPPQDRYGLTGEINQSVSAGYTIVVHSLNLERARAVSEQLRADGFRVMIMKAQVSGNTYYRVGLGQFPSVDAAQQAVNRLPQKFQNHNFIKRF